MNCLPDTSQNDDIYYDQLRSNLTESSVGFRCEMEGEHTKAKLRNISCFFVFGLISMVILSEVVSTALTDMLTGSSLSKETGDNLLERTTFSAESAAVVIAGLFHVLVKLSTKPSSICNLYAAGLVPI